ncbi:3-Deoxy-D-manno-octulosonate 8-phosphate (KDO 8-P) phosphatase [Luminiphilus syltensis NOR5-1B]|uniref:3-deoxy-D-manno-octulosonate 8-phosphate phosphatase KdsC n=1 Tax=Luminiphilus syltensis NOR5-1B TaxID=565045 RepID=B8KR82_9GAMM|nr:3-deoxy-D-manno-octulosonate 8-phosphate phosphatase [Luminiphilus syltensis]EED36779.1 3-Deoxy-D-manno-octulosonate 8-phosphate (KDO 8-P) phosphatase [Luminiphilus syltensis NOR5-1B]
MDTLALSAKAQPIRFLALDVDGVLTDGAVIYDNSGEELKAFNIKDGLGIKLAQRAGIEVAIITGRQSMLLERRAQELGITTLIQGREDKLAVLRDLLDERELSPEQAAYMGDDLPDLAAIMSVAVGACPSDATAEVLQAADWVSHKPGGSGAVRELIEMLLIAQGRWDGLIERFRP